MIIKTAALHAFLTALYIAAVSTFLSHAQAIFGKEEPKTVLVPIMMLSLLVFSAALVGSLIFGRPIFWYLDGKKKEALSLLIYTLGIFLAFVIAAVIAVLIVQRT